jgi:carbon storage regulator
MLVLSRKRDEAIVIGDEIKITVVKMKGNAVRLGIEAPQAVTIRRGELRDEKVTEPQAA